MRRPVVPLSVSGPLPTWSGLSTLHTLPVTVIGKAAALTVALIKLSQVEPTRTLAQDTLQRCQQALGPNIRSP